MRLSWASTVSRRALTSSSACVAAPSRSARATNVDVIAAVRIASSAIPSNMTNAAITRPANFWGVTSP